MKVYIKICFFLLVTGLSSFVFLCSCIEQRKPNIPEDQLMIELELKVPKKDFFELYYRTKNKKYTSKNSIRIKVEGSEEFRKIVFVLDKFVYPTNIKLDFGENKNQSHIILKHLIFRYNDAEHVFTKQEIEKYFKPNAGLKFDFKTMSGKGVEINNKYDPFLSSYNISKFVNRLILY